MEKMKRKMKVILTKNVLGAGSADDDLSPHGSYPDLDPGVSILRQLTRQYLIQLREKHSISHKLLHVQFINKIKHQGDIYTYIYIYINC